MYVSRCNQATEDYEGDEIFIRVASWQRRQSTQQPNTTSTPKLTRHNASPTPNTSTPMSKPKKCSTGSTSTSTKPTKEDVFLEIRVKLFVKDNSSGWVKGAVGTVRCCCTTSKKNIKLQSDNGSTHLNLEVGKLESLAKVIKETKKGKATYAKFSAVVDVNKGEESFLIQVKPELLDKLYFAMTLIFR